MAKKVINTGAGAVKFIKPDYIVATLFDGTEVDDSLILDDSDDIIIESCYEDSESEEDLTTNPTCPECGEPLVFEGGCNICKACGWSKCD